MFRLFATVAFFFIFSNPKISACGYSFVGDCSTSIALKINGTLDSFAVAPCPGVLKFDGSVLGNLQSLSIARAKAATWESCQNNVSAMVLFYRVYEQGFPTNGWQSLDLQEDYNTLVGPYTTRYRSLEADVNLTDGLTIGKTYVLEVYFQAEVDTTGDDFIPETTLLQNNSGQNYRLIFQYGGASAPPFIVAATKIVNVKCHGDSTGVAGVTVYGDQTDLFYQWSTGGNNFPILSTLLAGTYSVTVTGVGGYAASDTIEITQPMLLTKQITVAICDGEIYSIGSMNFTAQGIYKINLLGTNGACDTLTQLEIKVLPQPAVLFDVKVIEPFACSSQDSIHCIIIASTDSEDPVFEWVLDGQVISTDDSCFFVIYGFLLKTPSLTVTDKYGCSIFIENVSVVISQPAALLVQTIVTNPTDNLENGAITLLVAGGAPPYTVIWDNDSTGFSLSTLSEGTYCATVTDIRGCTSSVCATLKTSETDELSVEKTMKIAPNPAAPGQWVELSFPINFNGQEVFLEILNLEGRAFQPQNIAIQKSSGRFLLPSELPFGVYVIKATTRERQAICRLVVVSPP